MAKDGHVYQFEPFTGRNDTDDKLLPQLVGVKKATTFSGFCERHDSETFSAIENRPFQNTPEQKFLYHYRAFAQNYYDKAYKFKAIEGVRDNLAKEFCPSELRTITEAIDLNQHDVNELYPRKLTLEKGLRERNWETVEGYTFVGEAMPEIFTTNFFAPQKNFHGKIIQNNKSLSPLKWLSLTVTASDDRAVFLLCGDKNCPILHQFVTSFREMPLQTTAIVTYVFCLLENFIISPKWWDSLSDSNQQKFVNAFQGRYYRRELPNICDWKLKESSLC